jgi:nucleoside-diphosphate-sugar epimerase
MAASPGDAISTVLVTGASGFIGRALTTRLLGSGRFAVKASVRHPSSLLSDGIEQVVTGDLGPDTNWQAALSGADIVVHLAARAHVLSESTVDPLAEFRRVNVDATMNLARQACAAAVRRFVFVSSIGVNGNSTTGAPFSERDAPRPQEAYAVSKHEAEQALRALPVECGLETVVIRPPLVYGPGAPGNFGRLCRLVQRAPLLPFGAVHNRRSLVALDNLVDFIVTCMEHPSGARETFLVSDGEDLSTADLIRRLARAMGRPPRLLPIPPSVLMAGATIVGRREMAQRLIGSLQVDISKARRILGWVPPVSVDEGLRRAAADCR